VLSTALVQTRWLDSRAVQRDLSGPAFDFSVLKEQPYTIYIVVPPRRLRTHSSWVRLIFASIIQKMMKEAKPGKVPVCLLCDEFAALAGSSMGMAGEAADGFPTITSNMPLFRQHGVKLYSIWQDLAMARRIFGDGFETFLANAGVFQAFAPQDVVTAEFLSRRTGQTTKQFSTQTESIAPNPMMPQGEQVSMTAAQQFIPMPVVLPEDLRRMDVGFSIAFSHAWKGPMRLYSPWPRQVTR